MSQAKGQNQTDLLRNNDVTARQGTQPRQAGWRQTKDQGLKYMNKKTKEKQLWRQEHKDVAEVNQVFPSVGTQESVCWRKCNFSLQLNVETILHVGIFIDGSKKKSWGASLCVLCVNQ